MQPSVQELLQACIPTGFELVTAAGGLLRGQVPAVRELLDPKAPSVLVVYGDSFLSLDFRALLDAHASARGQGGQATVVYHRPTDLRVPERDRRTYHGVMSVDEQGRVSRFVEKPNVDEVRPGFDLANAAVFVCDRVLLEDPAFGSASNFSYDVFEPAVRTSGTIYGFNIGTGYRHDVGSLTRLYELNVSLLRREDGRPPTGNGTGTGILDRARGRMGGGRYPSPPCCWDGTRTSRRGTRRPGRDPRGRVPG